MATLATLIVKLTGDAGPFLSTLEKAEKRAGGFTRALGGIGSAAQLAAGVVVSGFAAVGTAAFSAAMKMDEAYDTIQIGTGATGETLDTLKTDFQEVFRSVPADADAVAGVIANLNSKLDVTGPLLQDISANVLEASRLMGGDAATNASLFARVIGDWGLPLEDASVNLDAMFVAAQKSGIGLDQLMSQVVQFGAPLRNMGFGFNESIALMAKWEKEGVNTELVLGSLRIAAGKFAKQNIPLRKGLLDTIETIKNTTDSSAALAKGMEVFGARAGPDMVAAIREGRFELGDLVEAMQNADGAIMATAEATEDFPEKFKKMVNKATVVLAPLGMKIMDVIGGALDAAGPFIEQAIPVIIGAFESLTSWIDANIGPAFNTIVTVLQTVIGWVQSNWPRVQSIITDAIERARAFVEPIIQAISAFIQTVFGAIGTFLQTHGEEIKTFIQNAWNTIQTIVSGIAEAIRLVVEGVFGGIAAWLQENGATVQGILSGIWNAIATIIETALNAAKAIVNGILALLKGDWEGFWNGISTTVETIVNGVVSVIQTVFGPILEWLNENVFQPISEVWNNFWGGLKKIVEDILNGIKKFFEDFVAGIRASLAGIQQMGEQALKGQVPGLPGVPAKGGIPKIPGGQHGLHLIVPPGFPSDTFPVMASSGERVDITPRGQWSGGALIGVLNIYALPGMNEKDLAEYTSREIGRLADSRRRMR